MKNFGRLFPALCAFARDRGGNFAMLAALAAVPMVGAAGLAIDYATMSRVRSELQQSLDAAVLAVAQRGDNISDAQAREIAEAYLGSNLAQDFGSVEIVRNGTSVTLKADTPAPLAFGGLFGYDNWTVGAASTADMAFASYEVALVLDTTGSMRGGKLRSMKDAVTGLIDDLSARVDNKERLKFALVPFSSFVNVGAHFGPNYDARGRRIPNTGAGWLDIEGISPIPQIDLQQGISRFDLYRHLGKEWRGCVETRMVSRGRDHGVDDTPANQSDAASLFVPAFAIDEPQNSGWSGYQNDYLDWPDWRRERPLDQSQEARALRLLKYGIPDPATPMEGWSAPRNPDYRSGRGPSQGCVTEPITPLTNDYRELKRKVRALEAEGNTNIMEGVAWGMRVLSPHEPFTEGSQDEPYLDKVMVVLTDGANVFGNSYTEYGSTYNSFGYLVDGRLNGITGGSWRTTEAMNEKTLAACTNAKNKGYIVYTIRLEEPDVATGEMLKQCATSPGHYFDTPSRSQLDEVFQDIRDGITKLRLSS